jgi:hypothetical protein
MRKTGPITTALAATLALTATAGPPPSAVEGPHPGTALPRILRVFDFEKAQETPLRFPRHFRRTVDAEGGFTRFGAMTLDDRVAFEGHWSFRYDLAGGALSAGVPSGVIPVMPGVDYEVRAAVRTEGLDTARAIVTAALVDADGSPIDTTRVTSAPLRTGGTWETVVVRVPGAPDAMDLVLDLRVVQRSDLPPTDTTTPRLDDVSGRAWFDAIVVRQTPRIGLETISPPRGADDAGAAAPSIALTVRDVAAVTHDVRLEVHDAWDERVLERVVAVPADGRRTIAALPPLPCGWYRLTCSIEETAETIAVAHATLAVLPYELPLADTALAIGLDRQTLGRDDLETRLAELRVRGVTVTVWDELLTSDTMGADIAAVRARLDRLLAAGYDVTARIDGVPHFVADELELMPDDVAAAFRGDAARPGLDGLLLDFGRRVSRWCLGVEPRYTDPAVWAAATDTLQTAVAAPVVLRPERARHVGAVLVRRFAVDGRSDGAVSIEPAGDASAGMIANDVARVALEAWRRDVTHMTIKARWSRDGVPSSALLAWRGVASIVAGRVFVETAALDDGVEAWRLDGPGRGETALLVWPQRQGSGARILDLGADPVTVCDLWGERTIVPRAAGGHVLPPARVPLLVTSIID